MTGCAVAALISNQLGTPFEISSTQAVLSAGALGLVNLALTCRPFTRLRAVLCAAMSAAFAGAVALLPELFFLHPELFRAKDWLSLALITACGAAVLLGGTRLAKKRFDL